MYPLFEYIIPINKGIDIIYLRLFIKQFLQFFQFLRVFFGKINAFVKIFIQVIKLPGIFTVIPGSITFSTQWVEKFGVMVYLRFPTILINRPGTINVIILNLVAGECFSIIKRI